MNTDQRIADLLARWPAASTHISISSKINKSSYSDCEIRQIRASLPHHIPSLLSMAPPPASSGPFGRYGDALAAACRGCPGDEPSLTLPDLTLAIFRSPTARYLASGVSTCFVICSYPLTTPSEARGRGPFSRRGWWPFPTRDLRQLPKFRSATSYTPGGRIHGSLAIR